MYYCMHCYKIITDNLFRRQNNYGYTLMNKHVTTVKNNLMFSNTIIFNNIYND